MNSDLITSYDRPLFVLRYRRGQRLLRIDVWSLACLLWLGFALAIPFVMKHGFFEFALAFSFELISIFLLSRLIFEIVDLIFLKEVRLYQDRIVKAWKFGGEREIVLAHARLEKTFGAIRAKTIYDPDTNWFLRPVKGVLYYEDLPAPKDAKKLNYLLAALSGRKPREVEEAVVIEKLIGAGDTPRILDKRTLDNIDVAVAHDYIEEKKFNRGVNVAFIVLTLFGVILPIFLLWFGIWWSLK